MGPNVVLNTRASTLTGPPRGTWGCAGGYYVKQVGLGSTTDRPLCFGFSGLSGHVFSSIEAIGSMFAVGISSASL
jgi:hypothetical protein